MIQRELFPWNVWLRNNSTASSGMRDFCSSFCFETRLLAACYTAFPIDIASQLKTVTKRTQYSTRAALTDYVLMKDVTLVLKSDWFVLYAAKLPASSCAISK